MDERTDGWMDGQMHGATKWYRNTWRRCFESHSIWSLATCWLGWWSQQEISLFLLLPSLTSSRCSGVSAIQGYISLSKPRCPLLCQSCSRRLFRLALPPRLVGPSLPLRNLFPHLLKDQIPPAVNTQGHRSVTVPRACPGQRCLYHWRAILTLLAHTLFSKFPDEKGSFYHLPNILHLRNYSAYSSFPCFRKVPRDSGPLVV